MISTTFANGNKEVTVTVTSRNSWAKEDRSRVYFELDQNNKRAPISALYQVISGPTRDKVIEVGGRAYGFELGIDCNSNTKRAAATDAVKELIAMIEAEYQAQAPVEAACEEPAAAQEVAKFYIIETNYTGPQPSEEHNIDLATIVISTAPAITNSSHEARVDGWCGTTDDMAVYAHGEYATLEDAQAALASKFAPVRDCDANRDAFESDDESVVAVYKPGRYTPMSKSATADWIYEGMTASVTAETTDKAITDLASEYEAAASSDGYALDGSVEALLCEYRQDQRDEQVAE